MFADKEKIEEAEFVMKDKDEDSHYARIASNIVKLFYAGKKIRSDEENEIEQMLLY
jgi:VIT1/CCC1 family predicted Fe2+/Mn2+ transporter